MGLFLFFLCNQLEQRVEQHNLSQLALEEKRAALLNVESQLRELEERYITSTVTIKDQLTQDLRVGLKCFVCCQFNHHHHVPANGILINISL